MLRVVGATDRFAGSEKGKESASFRGAFTMECDLGRGMRLGASSEKILRNGSHVEGAGLDNVRDGEATFGEMFEGRWLEEYDC